MHCNTTPCNKNNAVPYVKTWYKIISIATYTEIKIHRSQSFSHLRQYSFGRANKRRVEGAQSWMKYRELLYSFSLRQGRQEVEIQSGSQVRLLWYSSFLSLGWRAVAIMFYKLLIEEAVLNSRLQHLVFSFLLYRLGHILAGPGIIPVTAALLISL